MSPLPHPACKTSRLLRESTCTRSRRERSGSASSPAWERSLSVWAFWRRSLMADINGDNEPKSQLVMRVCRVRWPRRLRPAMNLSRQSRSRTPEAVISRARANCNLQERTLVQLRGRAKWWRRRHVVGTRGRASHIDLIRRLVNLVRRVHRRIGRWSVRRHLCSTRRLTRPSRARKNSAWRPHISAN